LKKEEKGKVKGDSRPRKTKRGSPCVKKSDFGQVKGSKIMRRQKGMRERHNTPGGEWGQKGGSYVAIIPIIAGDSARKEGEKKRKEAS